MSATRWSGELSFSSPAGVDRPQPRWSNSTVRNRSGAKKRRSVVLQPAPGPPWTNSIGRPSGVPHSS